MRRRADQDAAVFVVRRQRRGALPRAVHKRGPRLSGPGDGGPGRALDRLLRGRRPAGVGHQQRPVVRVPGRLAQILALPDIRSHHVCHQPRDRHTEQREYTICHPLILILFEFFGHSALTQLAWG